MGYTPTFDTVYEGSLHGQWPALPVWLSILPMADARGIIDKHWRFITSATGWPEDLLRQGIAALLAPDPSSRSPAEDGRRLIPLDPSRDWGWIVVNHALYREKARKAMRQAEETASGRDAARKEAQRKNCPAKSGAVRSCPAKSGAVRSCPAKSGAVRLSDSDSDSDSEKTKNPRACAREGVADSPEIPIAAEVLPPGLDPAAWDRWEAYRREIRKPLKPASIPAAQRKLAAVGTSEAQRAAIENAIAQGYQGFFPVKNSPPAKSRVGVNGFEWE